MPIDLKALLRQSLAGSSAQRPVETDVLAKGHRRSHVEAALMALYQAQEIYCCKITDKEGERVVWWKSGNVPSQTEFYGKGKQATAVPKTAKHPTRMGEFSRNLLAHIVANPGFTTTEYCDQLNIQKQRDRDRAACSIYNLIKIGWLRSEGNNPGKRYYPEAKA